MVTPDLSRSFSRRELLRLGVSVSLATFFAGLTGAAAALATRRIPGTEESLPVIGLGTSRVFDVGPEPADRAACEAVLKEFFNSGATLIDSSPMYRRAEAVSGDLVSGLDRTDDAFWATKVWADGQDPGVAQMRKSQALFHTNVIDLMQIHNLRDWKAHLPTLREWKDSGVIRYIGLTHSRSAAFDELEQVINKVRPDFVQLNYSIGEREAENRLLPLCDDNGIATLINRPFQKGGLFKRVAGHPLPEWAAEFDAGTWAQLFLKFILSHPAVTCAIPATADAEHMLDNLAAGYGRLPNTRQRQRIIEYFSAL
jgi:diketogulonate reductase-like aldo/keto reductase